MTLTKYDLIREAYSKLRMSGLTSNPAPEQIVRALRRQAGVIAAMPWSIGYIFANSIDEEDPNDDSGLTIDLLDPVSSIIAYKIAPDFGKQYSQMEYSDAEDTLARKFAEIEGSKYPTTLPIGGANQCTNSRYFYKGKQPAEHDLEGY